MAVSAPPRRELAWVCPGCGHGSPEPRDQQAHLDAHRQLRRFFEEWEAAGAADQAPDRSPRRRPLYYVAAALVLLAAISLWTVRSQGVDRPAPAGPAPSAQLPQPDAGEPPSVIQRPPTPPAAPTTSPRARAVPAPAAAVATVTREPAAPPAPAPAPPPTAPPTTLASTEPLLTVRGCLLQVLCVNLDG